MALENEVQFSTDLENVKAVNCLVGPRNNKNNNIYILYKNNNLLYLLGA